MFLWKCSLFYNNRTPPQSLQQLLRPLEHTLSWRGWRCVRPTGLRYHDWLSCLRQSLRIYAICQFGNRLLFLSTEYGAQVCLFSVHPKRSIHQSSYLTCDAVHVFLLRMLRRHKYFFHIWTLSRQPFDGCVDRYNCAALILLQHISTPLSI